MTTYHVRQMDVAAKSHLGDDDEESPPPLSIRVANAVGSLAALFLERLVDVGQEERAVLRGGVLRAHVAYARVHARPHARGTNPFRITVRLFESPSALHTAAHGPLTRRQCKRAKRHRMYVLIRKLLLQKARRAEHMRAREREPQLLQSGWARRNSPGAQSGLSAPRLAIRSAHPPAQQNFHLLLQFVQVTNVVMGSSADRVCFW